MREKGVWKAARGSRYFQFWEEGSSIPATENDEDVEYFIICYEGSESAFAFNHSHQSAIPSPVLHDVRKNVRAGLIERAFCFSV